VTRPAARHIYNLRQHQHIDETTTFTVPLVPCRATFLALTTEPVRLPKIALPRTLQRGKQAAAHVTIRGGRGLHAVRLQVKTPDGQPAEWLNQVVMVGPEGADVPLPFAFNDPVGRWTVRAIDPVTLSLCHFVIAPTLHYSITTGGTHYEWVRSLGLGRPAIGPVFWPSLCRPGATAARA
jgi:hypothetical protein